MKKVGVTGIKLACVITVLLDCKKHVRKDIIKKSNILLDNYRDSPEISKTRKIDDSFLTDHLNPMVKEKIVESKIIPAEGKGPLTKYQHSLILSIEAFRKIAETFMSLYYFETYVIRDITLSLKIIRSPYGHKCITTFLIEWLESILDTELTKKEKDFILLLVSGFPLALYYTTTIQDKIKEFLFNFPEIKINFNKKEFYFWELLKALDFDVCNPFLKIPYPFEYNHSLKLNLETMVVSFNKAVPEFDLRKINHSRTYIDTERNEIGVKCRSNLKSEDKPN